MKILYAASNNNDSYIQLSRFLENVDKDIVLKIAGFNKAKKFNINLDYTLDHLFDVFDNQYVSTETETYAAYYEIIKKFAPDLIISDLEYFTSSIGIELGITTWQVSTKLLNYFLIKNKSFDLFKYRKQIYVDYNYNQKILNIIENSNKNFIYSHFCDYPGFIEDYYKDGKHSWIRPYYKTFKQSELYKHNIVGIDLNNKHILNCIKNNKDVVLFSKYKEKYFDFVIKNYDEKEYYSNLKNCNLFICNGETNYLSDAFYNDVPVVTFTDYFEPNSIINCVISDKLKLSKNYTTQYKLDNLSFDTYIFREEKQNVGFLHEKINEFAKTLNS